MSSDVIISTRQISPDASFDDLDALNRDLRASEAGELASRILDGDYDIVRFDGGRLRFIDADDIEYRKLGPTSPGIEGCYEESTNVWACWGLEASRVLAAHLVSGAVVLQFEAEWGDVFFHKITPGSAVEIEPSF
jgi:hypothetical protein